MWFWSLAAFALLSAMALTVVGRRYALAKQIIDIPNARSSHTSPTPRGGGMAIVVVFYVVSLALGWRSGLPAGYLYAILVAGSLVVGIGWLDDHGHVQAVWRFVVHLLAAGLALFWIGSLPFVQVGPWLLDLGMLGYPLGLLFIIWIVNLYNFMDGIDGMAGLETITVTSAAAFLLWQNGAEDMAGWIVLLGMASAGFLVWNWPPARIFMGDGGSGFLGFALAVFALLTAGSGRLAIWPWLILFGVFVVDATVTLLRRVAAGEKWHEAHRSHAYQYASRRYNSHRIVTLAVAAINVGWLFPLAWIASAFPNWGAFCLVVAWTPLMFLALKFQAGVPESMTTER